jgi:hypothetical protein
MQSRQPQPRHSGRHCHCQCQCHCHCQSQGLVPIQQRPNSAHSAQNSAHSAQNSRHWGPNSLHWGPIWSWLAPAQPWRPAWQAGSVCGSVAVKQCYNPPKNMSASPACVFKNKCQPRDKVPNACKVIYVCQCGSVCVTPINQSTNQPINQSIQKKKHKWECEAMRQLRVCQLRV